MKKLLLLALVAIFGVSVQAQNAPEVMKGQPAGTLTTYKRVSGKMFAYQKGEDGKQKLSLFDLAKLAENGQPAGDLLMVTAADDKTVYLNNALTFGTYINGDQFNAWIKGTKDGNVITVPAGQYIYYRELQDGSKAGIQVGYMELKEGKIQPIDDPIKFYVDGVSIKLGETYMEGDTMENLKLKMLGGYWSDEKSLFCGDLETVFTTDPTGIETVAAGANKQVVGETYFDLSGRQISKAGKGVSIKNVKFADGTTKSVKFIGK
ncbi:hypothetical protein [Prevotella aurantiaca]|jgi:hypothetical protein